MKKAILTSIFSFLFIISFSQKWKPNLGFEGGMGGGGMSQLLKSNNPLITENAQLRKTWAYSYGPFIQLMKPAFGFEAKLNFNSFENDAESYSTPESFKFKYLSVPMLIKVRLSSREGITGSSWSDESYTLIGNTLYHSPSQYSAGGERFTTSAFLFGGIQYDQIKSVIHSYGTLSPTVVDVTGSFINKGYSYIVGLEMATNMFSLDFSYMKSMKSISPTIDNKFGGFFIKLKVRVL